MKKKLLIIFWYLLVFSANKGFTQVSLLFNNGKNFNLTVEDLVNFSLINLKGEINVDITIQGTHKESNTYVFKMKSNDFRLSSSIASFKYTTNSLVLEELNNNFLDGINILRSGNYNVCVSVKNHDNSEELVNECTLYLNMPLNPPMLVFPENKSEISNLTPNLTWIPPTPILSGKKITYRLRLAQILNNQNEFEAIINNIPLYEATDIKTTLIQYPFNAQPLIYNQHYVWQIESFDGDVSVGKSEVWRFNLKQDSIEAIKAAAKMLSFMKMSSQIESGVYSTSEELTVQIPNYQSDTTQLSIYNTNKLKVADIPTKAILDLGDNKFLINLREVKGLKNGSIYLLKSTTKGDEMYVNIKYITSK